MCYIHVTFNNEIKYALDVKDKFHFMNKLTSLSNCNVPASGILCFGNVIFFVFVF